MRAFKRHRYPNQALTFSQWFFELIGMSVDTWLERYRRGEVDRKTYKQVVTEEAICLRRLMTAQLIYDHNPELFNQIYNSPS